MKPAILQVEVLLQPTDDERFLVSLAASVAPHLPIIFNAVTPDDPNRNRRDAIKKTVDYAEGGTFMGMPLELEPNLPAAIPVTRTTWKEALDTYGLDKDAPRPRFRDGRLFDFLEPGIDRYFDIDGKTIVFDSNAGIPVVTQHAARANTSAEFRKNYGQYLIGVGYLNRCQRLKESPKLALEIHGHGRECYECYELQANGELLPAKGPTSVEKRKPAGDIIRLERPTKESIEPVPT